MAAALDADRQSVVGACRGPRRAPRWSRRRASRSRRWSAREPRNVVFTSGGTEANMLALSPALRRATLLVSAIEHPSVLERRPFAGGASDIPVTAAGVVDLAALERRCCAGRGAAAGLADARQQRDRRDPAGRGGGRARARGRRPAACRCGAGGRARIACDFKALGADLLTLSAHKIGGPQGVGALIRARRPASLDPLIKGGGQERGARAGTENVAGIAGFGAAAAAVAAGSAAEAARMAALRDKLEAGLKADRAGGGHFRRGRPRGCRTPRCSRCPA